MPTFSPSFTSGAIRQNSRMSASYILSFQFGESRAHEPARRRLLQVHRSAVVVHRLLGRFEKAHDPQSRVPITEWSSVLCDRVNELAGHEPERLCAIEIRRQHVAVAI